jgi:hypothetical protein
MINPRRNWEVDREGAIKYLERVILVLHVNPRFGYGKTTLDPIIARDVGGFKELMEHVTHLENCILLIKNGEDHKAINILHMVSNWWLHHSLERFIECYEGESDPLDGVSTIDKLRKVLP